MNTRLTDSASSTHAPARPWRLSALPAGAVAALVGASAMAAACASSPQSAFPDGGGSSSQDGASTSDGGSGDDVDWDGSYQNLVGDGSLRDVTYGGDAVRYPTHPTCPSSTVTAGTVPPTVASLFSGATADTSTSPTLVYPTSGTMFPPNMADILFQWRVTTGNVFWLHFAGTDPSFPTLDVYTDGRNATCDEAATGGQCWESGETDLMCYLGMAADRGLDLGTDVLLTIESMDSTQPGTKHVSPQYTLHVAKTDITGAVYYWSTTSQGIRRAIFNSPIPPDGGPVTPPRPIDYITNAVYPPTTLDATDRCAACHTLSHDGTKLAVALFGDVLGIIDVVPMVPPPITLGPASQGFGGPYIGSSWSSFSYDSTKIITASTGVMTVRDVATGNPIGQDGGVVGLPAETTGSMPQWSPDGQHLVFASTPADSPPNVSYGRHLYGSSIALMTANGDGFDSYQIVAPSTQTNCQAVLDGGLPDPAYAAGARETYANPMFSWDNKWLVFSHADCESEEDPTAALVLTPVQPNAPQNHLVQANTQEGDHQVSDVTNGMPVWGPTNDPRITWIAFTTTRDYGVVLTQGSKIGADLSPPFQGWQVRQLWIAAVDLTKLASGDPTAIDPSYPAFRFSAQDLTENNHRPFWTVDTLPTWNNGSPPQVQ